MDSIVEGKSSREVSMEQRQVTTEVAGTQDRPPQTLKKSPGQKDGAASPEVPSCAPTQWLTLSVSTRIAARHEERPTTWGQEIRVVQSNYRNHYSSKLKHKR